VSTKLYNQQLYIYIYIIIIKVDEFAIIIMIYENHLFNNHSRY